MNKPHDILIIVLFLLLWVLVFVFIVTVPYPFDQKELGNIDIKQKYIVDYLEDVVHPRTIIIGDTHGCVEELNELLEKVHFKQNRDRLIFIGDLIGKGPFSKDVLDVAINSSSTCIRGNHDHILINWYNSPEEKKPEMKPSYLKIAKSLSAEHWNYLLSCPLYDTLPEYKCILVHAGVEPDIPLEEQSAKMLMNIRNIESNGKGSKSQDLGTPWIDTWDGPELIIFGHDAIRGIQVKENEEGELIAMGLDSGAVYGGQLSAFVLPERKLLQMPAHKIYEQPKLK